MKKIMRLQSIGQVQGTPAGELKVGDVTRWNFGDLERIVEIDFSPTGKTVYAKIEYMNREGVLVQTERTMRTSRLVNIVGSGNTVLTSSRTFEVVEVKEEEVQQEKDMIINPNTNEIVSEDMYSAYPNWREIEFIKATKCLEIEKGETFELTGYVDGMYFKSVLSKRDYFDGKQFKLPEKNSDGTFKDHTKKVRYFMATGVNYDHDETKDFAWAEKGWIFEGNESDQDDVLKLSDVFANTTWWEYFHKSQMKELTIEQYEKIYALASQEEGWGDEEQEVFEQIMAEVLEEDKEEIIQEIEKTPMLPHIVANLSSFVGEWRLKTDIALENVRGLKFHSFDKEGYRIYYATKTAFPKLQEAYRVEIKEQVM
jgi:hypothetical protein